MTNLIARQGKGHALWPRQEGNFQHHLQAQALPPSGPLSTLFPEDFSRYIHDLLFRMKIIYATISLDARL